MTAFVRGARIVPSTNVAAAPDEPEDDDYAQLLSGARLVEGGGALVANNARPGVDEHAFYGLARLNGREFRVRAWWKRGRNGEWLKLRFMARGGE
jgi:hypothetical protein